MAHIERWQGWDKSTKESEKAPIKQALGELLDNRFMTFVTLLDAHSRNDRHMADEKEAVGKAGLNVSAAEKKKIMSRLTEKWSEEDGDYVEAETGQVGLNIPAQVVSAVLMPSTKQKRKRAQVVKDIDGNKVRAFLRQ